MADGSVIVIGGGIAGLASGIYSQANGWDTTIFEMHATPGGLCTSWRRHGYVFDGCIQWFVGGKLGSESRPLWDEVGATDGLELLAHDTVCSIGDLAGHGVVLWSDIDRLEASLLEQWPSDQSAIRELIRGARFMASSSLEVPANVGTAQQAHRGDRASRRMMQKAHDRGWCASTFGRRARAMNMREQEWEPVTFEHCEHVGGPFYHGTKSVLHPGDELVPGFGSNFQDGRVSNNIYFTGLVDTAAWGAELATALAGSEERGHIYVVEPLGPFEDDPNVTNKRFPGNPTESYRTRDPLRVVVEVEEWEGHSPEMLKEMLDHLAQLREQGLDVIED